MVTARKSIMGKILAIVFLFLLSLLGTILLVEFGLRVFGYKPELRDSYYLTENWFVLDSNTIMILPHLLSNDYYSDVENADKVIVSMGDSFTEGYPVSLDQSYPSVLEKLLSAKKKVKVINAGLGNSGPDRQLRLFKEYILPKLKPDIVIWSFYPNDIWDNVTSPSYGLNKGKLVALRGEKNWLYIRQIIYDRFHFIGDIRLSSYLFNLILASTEKLSLSQVPRSYKERPELWGIEKLKLEVKEINRLAELNGFQVYFVLIAPQAIYLSEIDRDNWAVNAYWEMYSVLCNQPHFIDAYFNSFLYNKNIVGEDKVLGIHSSEKVDIFSNEAKDVNEFGNRHYNELGYWLMARLIESRLSLD